MSARFAGVGGFGVFATLEGLNHGGKINKNRGDGVKAIFEGTGVVCTTNRPNSPNSTKNSATTQTSESAWIWMMGEGELWEVWGFIG